MIESHRRQGVSICIPNWNHKNYLPRSVGSAIKAASDLLAHGVPCQVLIVDDFSRDGSQRLLGSIASCDAMNVVDVILSDENNGLGATRNSALRNARYQYVCFMDADNELVPSNLIHFWRAATITGAALTYGNLLVKDDENQHRLLSNDKLHEGIYDENYIDAFCLIDADQVEESGSYYGKHAAAHEDWELLLHLISEEKLIVFVPMLFGYYHVSTLSMIRTTTFDHAKIYRTFHQRKTGMPVGYHAGKMYHPAVGWL